MQKKYNKFKDIPLFVKDKDLEYSYSIKELIYTIDSFVKYNSLILNADFQRLHTWTKFQQIAWLEFIFRGGKSSRLFYFNNPNWDKKVDFSKEFVLVDGKQRINSLQKFYKNEIKIFGNYFKDFKDKSTITDHNFKININTLQTRAEVIQWYIDMNSGGTPHTKEEIKKAKKLLQLELKK